MKPEFLNEGTTLESLYEMGWYIERNGYGWWFRHKDTNERQPVPRWMSQVAVQCQQGGMRSVTDQLAGILKGKSPYLGPCLPYTPKPKD
jgi:hypothetical protein